MIGDKAEVLIIDDDSGMCTTLADIFEDEGHRIEACSNAKEALELLKKSSFDIVIVDIKLPDMSGVKLLEPVKEMNPEAAVIMMTGYASVETAIDAMKQGAYAYLTKPLNMEELKALIKKTLKGIRLASENKRLIDDLQHANTELEKANLKLKDVDQRKSEFLSNVSHELRTPLTSIKSFAEILLKYENKDAARQKKFLTIIDDEADRLTRLIDELLDLDRMKHGELEWEFAPCDISNIVQNSINKVEPLIKEKNIILSLNLPSQTLIINGNEDRLKEVLVNLIGNAIKFTPSKGKITITVEKKEDDIQVSIADTGMGIPENKLSNIFERFQRLDNPINRKVTGTGLGLYICKQIIEKHKGEIWVESQEGKGSKFIFVLPEYKEEELIKAVLKEAKIKSDGQENLWLRKKS